MDSRVDRYLRYALTFVCGGASDLTKSEEVVGELGIRPGELSLFRYRGNGCPGPTRLETQDGRSFELTYQDMWEDEATWRIQPRCKICPDAIGESADLAASDVWPGGGPVGEDEGFNGVIVRTERGLELYQAALAAGAVVETQRIGFRDFDEFQPHQVRKKRAVWARLAGMRAAGCAVPETHNLRLTECARLNTLEENLAEERGARRGSQQGRLAEPPAVKRPWRRRECCQSSRLQWRDSRCRGGTAPDSSEWHARARTPELGPRRRYRPSPPRRAPAHRRSRSACLAC